MATTERRSPPIDLCSITISDCDNQLPCGQSARRFLESSMRRFPQSTGLLAISQGRHVGFSRARRCYSTSPSPNAHPKRAQNGFGLVGVVAATAAVSALLTAGIISKRTEPLSKPVMDRSGHKQLAGPRYADEKTTLKVRIQCLIQSMLGKL